MKIKVHAGPNFHIPQHLTYLQAADHVEQVR